MQCIIIKLIMSFSITSNLGLIGTQLSPYSFEKFNTNLGCKKKAYKTIPKPYKSINYYNQCRDLNLLTNIYKKPIKTLNPL